jgi:hypothetical protein
VVYVVTNSGVVCLGPPGAARRGPMSGINATGAKPKFPCSIYKATRMAEDLEEYVQLTIPEAFIYKVPPRTSAQGHK